MNSSGGAARLRRINRDAVRTSLRERGPLTQAALADATGLSLATCANVIRDLLGAGEAMELHERESAGGRPARRYAINPGHTMAALIAAENSGDGSRECIAHAVADSLGDIVASGSDVVGRISPAALGVTLARLRREYPAIRAVALSVPGPVRNGKALGLCDANGLEGADLAAFIREEHGLEATVENDVNFAAIGYYRARRDLERAGLCYLYFAPDNCPGAGIIVDGTLARGRSGFAGEVSYMPLRYGGRNAWRDGKRRAARIGDICAAAAAMLNPDVVVVTGDLPKNYEAAAAADHCRTLLPAEHLPEFVVGRDFAADRLAGMTAAALQSVGCDVMLVDKKGNWC